MASAPEPEPLLRELNAQPGDGEPGLRGRAAEALRAHGREREAIELLAPLTNLTAHDGPTLPCLCQRCLDPDRGDAEADGIAFARRFAVAHGRVLYYWAPVELADDPGLRRSVEARLTRRLARPAR